MKNLNLRKIFLYFFILFIAFLATTRSSPGQENPFDPEIDRHLRLGAFRIRPFFAIQDTGYDSNVYRRKDSSKSDFTSTLSPGCDTFFYLGERGSFFLREQVDFVLFASESSQNHANSRTKAQINLFYNRFSFKTKGQYDYLKERPNNEIDIRTRYAVSKIHFATAYEHSSKTSAGLSLSRRRYQYRDDEFFGARLKNSLNRDEDSIIFSYSQKILSKTTVTLESELVEYDFEYELSKRDSEAKYYTIGFKFDPSASIKGDLKAGYASFTPDKEEFSDYKGLIGKASLAYRITESTRMSLTYNKDIQFTIYQNNLFYKEDSYGFSVFQYLARRFGVEVGATLFKIRYTEPGNITLESGETIYAHRRDDINKSYVEFKYKINDQYHVGLRVARWKRETNLFRQNVEQTVIGTTVGYQF